MNSGFTIEELTMLGDLLREDLSELRMEIANTDDYDFRQGLKKKSEMLQNILAKLEKSKVLTVN